MNITHLKEYFYSIIPETLYNDDPVIKDILDIFLEYIEEKIVPIYNLNEIFDMNNKKINEELLKTYLSDLYEIFNEAKYNNIITKELQLIMDGMGVPYNSYTSTASLIDILTYEHIKSAKDYKQKKGTKFAIEYIYNMVKDSGLQPFGIQKNVNDFNFEADEENEYNFKTIQGSVIEKIYHNIVAYATHPLGFTYTYEMVSLLELIDYFGYNITYINNFTYIQCISGEIFSFNDKTVVQSYVEKEVGYVKIVFSGLDYIVQTSTSLIYYNEDDTINKDFSGCALYYDHSLKLIPTTRDEIEFEEDEEGCTWFDINGNSFNYIGKLYNYFIDGNYIKGVIGLAPFVLCEVTSFRQHYADGISLYTSSPELIDWYYNNPYEVKVLAKCDDNVECDGYGIVCGYPNYNVDVCDEFLAFDNVTHQMAFDNIEIELIED